MRADDTDDDSTRTIREALAALGIRRLVLGIHDQCFPSAPGLDSGRGTPYGPGAAELLRFVAQLGFDGVQLGPQGQTSLVNPSPYDGTLFSRNVLSIALPPLVREPRWHGILDEAALDAVLAGVPDGPADRVRYAYVFDAQRRALRRAYEGFVRACARGGADLGARFDRFARAHAAWLERDALYDALCRASGGQDWSAWPEPDRSLFAPAPDAREASAARVAELRAAHAEEIRFYAFCQFVAHEQHAELLAEAARLGLVLYGDLQIGYSRQDLWSYRSLFLPGYRMGAPPSRTNPAGQPWNYPVLDPEQYYVRGPDGVPAPGPVLRLLSARMDKLLAEFGGVRIDHPHGLVCPWVYRTNQPDPFFAVQHGARLFASPNLPDHPELARYAIATAEQLDPTPGARRYDDGWVRWLSAEQVRRYSAVFDTVVEHARKHGRDTADVVCEVLSTLPYPLRRVMELHGLGRFRVTQKADVRNPADVYRSENAAPNDWIMVGNHDTRPLWLLLEVWQRTGEAGAQAAYLAQRLCPEPAARAAFAARLACDPRALATAKFADIFVGPARNVMIWFSDLFGLTQVYNAPGTVSEDNWSLRLTPDYQRAYAERLARGEALNVPAALAMALRARGFAGELVARVEGVGRGGGMGRGGGAG